MVPLTHPDPPGQGSLDSDSCDLGQKASLDTLFHGSRPLPAKSKTIQTPQSLVQGTLETLVSHRSVILSQGNLEL